MIEQAQIEAQIAKKRCEAKEARRKLAMVQKQAQRDNKKADQVQKKHGKIKQPQNQRQRQKQKPK